MKNFEINIKGQVQGVGFRPYVYRTALDHKLCGEVSNDVKGVHVKIQCDAFEANQFMSDLISNAPTQSKIDSYVICEAENQAFDAFRIVESENKGLKEVRLSPDFGLCKDCREDLDNISNRRFEYAFTTCTNCGPRYSIIKALPYDRPFTTMEDFQMCPTCSAEYQDPENRRFFSQTNSCPECAVTIELFKDGEKINMDQSQIVDYCAKALESGKIIAAKGIGGFLLLCDANNKKTIQRLRLKKQRADKPFALLYPSIEMVGETFDCSHEETKLLENSSAPIVLLPLKNDSYDSLCLNEIAPNLNKIGIMLPYAPLLYLLAKSFGKALIATSGNLNGSPIIYENKQAVEELSRFSDLILIHNRDITSPQDDSVLQYNKFLKAPVFFRRSRGFAPSYFGTFPKDYPEHNLALGAHLKASFALSSTNQIYISQYLGNLDSYEAEQEYIKTYDHLSSILDYSPKYILTDLHPEYFSNVLGQQMAKSLDIPITFVQHHKAHFAAVLAENNLINSKENILGIIWDGTGYGEDQNIWGGEFFSYSDCEIKRAFHLKPFPVILGDKMAKEPRLSALSLTQSNPELSDFTKAKFDQREWTIYNQKLALTNIYTSSIGRLFDATASLIGLIDKSTYEGQAAMYLEALAQKFKGETQAYLIEIEDDQVSYDPIISGIIRDIESGKKGDEIAYKFHLSLVKIIEYISRISGIKKIAFSGGVFQNQLLVDLIIQNLENKCDLYSHKDLSPNDECISFGQLMFGYIKMKQHLKNQESQLKSECYETS